MISGAQNGDNRRLWLRRRVLPATTAARGRPPAARRTPAPRCPRTRVRLGELTPAAGGLAQARIAYEHHPELAPTTELRQLQYAEDDRQGVGKRSRRELAAEYTRRYTTEILDRADLTPIVSELPSSGTAALLCVERDPEACHRSLIAERLAQRHAVSIEHLRPAD